MREDKRKNGGEVVMTNVANGAMMHGRDEGRRDKHAKEDVLLLFCQLVAQIPTRACSTPETVTHRSGHLKRANVADGNDTVTIGTELVVVRRRSRKILKETIKTGCLSEMKCISMSKKRQDGSSVECFEIIYTFEHNHALPESENDTGTKYLSAESREKIKRLLQRGGSVKEVLQRMQTNAKHFAEFGKSRIFRDDIITYQDVYNIYHQMMIKEVERDKDPDLSATMWIEELAKDGYYTCYQSGLFYGFSSPWQLEQLKLNGKIICFDGTHKVYG
jgi:hypothetical protein